MLRLPVAVPLALAGAAMLAGCGLSVQSADLFLMSRQGPQGRLTLLVNDDGTIRCDGSTPRTIPDSTLIAARDLADDLDKDAKKHLHLPARPGSVNTFSVKLQDGSISFADDDTAGHPELARAALFAVQAAAGPCLLSG